MLFKILDIKKFKFNNNKGSTLIAVLGTAVVGGLVVAGLNKYIESYAARSKDVIYTRQHALIRNNVSTIFRSEKAWSATVIQETPCFPGSSGCNIYHWYDRTNSIVTAVYIAAAERWVVPIHKTSPPEQYGLGLMSYSGFPLFEDTSCSGGIYSYDSAFINCMESAGHNQYVIIRVDAPSSPPTDSSQVPSFVISISDPKRTKKSFSIRLLEDDLIAYLGYTPGTGWNSAIECPVNIGLNSNVNLDESCGIAAGSDAIVGPNAVSGSNPIAFGVGATALGVTTHGGISLGAFSSSEEGSLAIGRNALSNQGTYSIAIGGGEGGNLPASALGSSSIAIGSGASVTSADKSGMIVLGGDTPDKHVKIGHAAHPINTNNTVLARGIDNTLSARRIFSETVFANDLYECDSLSTTGTCVSFADFIFEHYIDGEIKYKADYYYNKYKGFLPRQGDAKKTIEAVNEFIEKHRKLPFFSEQVGYKYSFGKKTDAIYKTIEFQAIQIKELYEDKKSIFEEYEELEQQYLQLDEEKRLQKERLESLKIDIENLKHFIRQKQDEDYKKLKELKEELQELTK